MNLFSDEAPFVSAFIWSLAAWTISVHIAVAMNASFNRLVLFAPITLLAAAIGWFITLQRTADIETSEEDTNTAAVPWLLAAALVLTTYQFGYFPFWLSALVPTTYRFGYFPFWLSALVLVVSAWARITFGTPKPAVMISMHRNHKTDAIGLISLCAVGVLITLLLHQPDIDDGFYISVAADAHRHPDRAIWSTDTVHDDPRLPVFLPIYKTEAYEHLIALAARLLHVSSVRAAHTALPIAFSIFVVFAWAMLARTIDPEHWLAIAATAILISLLAGEAKQGPANYTFTRLQQGKSVMVSAIVPVLCVYAWRFTTSGGWKNCLMLAIAQIAGVGLSSTAILIGPAVACSVGFFCAPLRPRPLDPVLRSTSETGVGGVFRRLILIGVTCVYPISMALLMRSKMLAVSWLAQSRIQTVPEVVVHILGEHKQSLFFLAVIAGAWTVAPRRSRTLLLAPSILLLGVLINPLITRYLQMNVFSPLTYWRVMWVMPWMVWSATLVVGFSLLAGRLVSSDNKRISQWTAAAVGAVLLILTLAWHPIWRRQNGTHFQFGGLAVDEPEYDVALKVVTETPPGMAALAPEVVACWTAVQDDRPPLIFVRSFYTQSTPDAGGAADVQMRNHLGEIAGKSNLDHNDVATLLAGANRYRLGSIVLQKNAGTDVADTLKRAGFQPETIGAYSVWTRH